ncbi:hypothetical protein ElyMa_002549200 [Elysia marginata]|uniref:Phosphoribosyltransferase domain-containing protein n=1 Tax=Elysia marginata TaxID=1093978 RepID=A0AAV4GUZ4_9GAST|nr:hypothetical protein ElyMa_002549200 [Elysia marginata]
MIEVSIRSARLATTRPKHVQARLWTRFVSRGLQLPVVQLVSFLKSSTGHQVICQSVRCYWVLTSWTLDKQAGRATWAADTRPTVNCKQMYRRTLRQGDILSKHKIIILDDRKVLGEMPFL